MKRFVDLASFLLQVTNAIPGGQRLMSVMKILLPVVLVYAAYKGFSTGGGL